MIHIETKTIEQLEAQLHLATKRQLIVSWEHIMNKDCILIQLKEDCPDEIKQKLKTHIKQTYRSVSFVTTSGYPNRCYLYVRYNDDGC